MNGATPYGGMAAMYTPAQYPYPAAQFPAGASNPYGAAPYGEAQQYPYPAQQAYQAEAYTYAQPGAAQPYYAPQGGYDSQDAYGQRGAAPVVNPWGGPAPAWDPALFEETNGLTLPATDPQAQQKARPKADPKKKNPLKRFFNQAEKPDTASKKILRVATNLAFWALCIALLGGSILFALNKDPDKNYFGYRAYNVLTNSMAPNADGSSPPGGFVKGDTIIVQMCSPQQIKENDIVTFNPNPNDPESTAYLTHRVVRILEELGGKQGLYFVTKGDHNKSEDPPIAGAAIIGKKVAMIPKVGALLKLVRDRFALSVVVIVSLFGTILMLQWYFSKPKDGAQPKKKPSGMPEAPEPPTPPEMPGFPGAPGYGMQPMPQFASYAIPPPVPGQNNLYQ